MEKKKLVIVNPYCQLDFELNWFEMWVFKRIWKERRYKISKNPKLRGYKINRLIVDEL